MNDNKMILVCFVKNYTHAHYTQLESEHKRYKAITVSFSSTAVHG